MNSTSLRGRSLPDRRAHNPNVAGSIPAPATISQAKSTTAADGPALKSPPPGASQNDRRVYAHDTERAPIEPATNGLSAAPLKHAPNPLRWRICCPDCGWIPQDTHWAEMVDFGHIPFDCQRCGAHYATVDFEAEMEEKHKAQHHNHATADLTSESLP